MQTRPYQQKMEDDINLAWEDGYENVLAVLPTGSGKTFVFSHIGSIHRGDCVLIAHRQELVGQISVALASWGIYHNIIAPPAVIKFVNYKHMQKFGKTFYDAGSGKTVAGVNTLLCRSEDLEPWLLRQTLWIMDEAHHIVRKNMWGKVVALMPNAKGLGVTATAIRASGEGLGRHAHGVFDKMLVGPPMRTIIDEGYLSDYRVLSIPNDIDIENVDISKVTGDYVEKQLRVEVKKSTIVGDVVEHYLKHANGKLGITFVTDIETGAEIAEKYRANGVTAECISHKTPDAIRSNILDKFERREVMQLINVDLFGEGFDLPAVEVISMARHTQSYALYCQQFGRGLRLCAGKTIALILDHVGNVLRHGLPDMKNTWSLDARDKKKKKLKDPDDIPVRVCVKCSYVYERIFTACPDCGLEHKPARNDGPEQVDGDLVELDVNALRELQRAADKMDQSDAEYRHQLEDEFCPELGIRKNVRVHKERQQVQKTVRAITMMWMRNHAGKPESEIQKRFFWLTGVDMLSARSLGRKDAKALAECLLMQL